MRYWILAAAAITLTAVVIVAYAGAQMDDVLPPSRISSADGPSVVIGERAGKDRPVRSLSFSYPETAIQVGGEIFVANARGGTIERISGDMATTIFDSEDAAILNDIDYQGGSLFVLHGERSRFLELSTSGAVVSETEIPSPTHLPLSVSSLEVSGERILVSAVPVRGAGPTAKRAGESILLERKAGQWSVVGRASEITGSDSTFRDAIYNDDGSIAAIVGEFFAVITKDGMIKTAKIGQWYGGGILPVSGGWLVGCHTYVCHISHTMDISTHVLPTEFANVGDIQPGDVEGTVIVTDTDRQVVYIFDGEKAETFGGRNSLKISDMEATPEGRLLLLENASPRIMAYDPATGDISNVAGTGSPARSTGANGAAKFTFYYPSGMAVAPDGSLFVSEANYRIVRVKDGRVEIFAGDVHGGVPAEGQPRLEARFGALRGLDVDSKGRLLIVDRGNHTLWRIGLDDAVERVMGTGQPGKWVEGQPAETQPLNAPMDVFARDDGSILITDTYNNAIVEIDPQGVVRRFAGIPRTLHYQGFGAYSGDGGPALEAEFNTPWRISEDKDGNIYVLDQFNHAVRRIAPDGIITTVLGGSLGDSENGSRMNLPGSIAVLDDFLYVGDNGNSVVRSAPIAFAPEP